MAEDLPTLIHDTNKAFPALIKDKLVYTIYTYMSLVWLAIIICIPKKKKEMSPLFLAFL